jgi:hypothetical protein
MGENDRKQNDCVHHAICVADWSTKGCGELVGGGVVYRSSASEVDCINGELPL